MGKNKNIKILNGQYVNLIKKFKNTKERDVLIYNKKTLNTMKQQREREREQERKWVYIIDLMRLILLLSFGYIIHFLFGRNSYCTLCLIAKCLFPITYIWSPKLKILNSSLYS